MALPAFLVSLFLLLHLRISASPDLSNFTFHGFSSSNVTLEGSSTLTSNGLLCLTNTTKQETGYAFLSTPVHFNYNSPFSFSTTFVFAVVPTYPGVGVHGMTFMISPSNHIEVGSRASKYFGLFNDTTDGNASNHIVAIEFDLVPNSELKDINDNHVGIDVNSAVSVAAQTAGYYSEHGLFTNLTLLSGDPLQVWVEYDGRHAKLDVTLASLNITRPTAPLCSANVNLTGVLLDEMYLGFSGTSGKATISQFVLGWSFRIDGEADPLDLSRLPKLPRTDDNKGQLIFLMVLLPLVSAAVVALGVGGVFVLVKRSGKYAEVLEEWEHEYGPHRISYKDLFRATKEFGDSELLGCGGFGKVYKGVLPRSRTEVAVKRVSHDSRQGMKEFVAEIASIGRMRHRNLVQLLGYCRRKDELLLVYDYMPNGSLDRLLFDRPSEPLDWDRRLTIIKGVAAGLLYLHEGWEQVVIHRDVKASNVMLDGEYNARLGDFGLARLYDHGTHPQTTHVVGTMGYLAPELARAGRATKATDVFAFGMFVLEVVCGRRPIEPRAAVREDIVLVDWVVRRWVEGGNLVGAADTTMDGGCYKEDEVEMVMRLGLLCAHGVEEARPSMREVVQVLEGELKVPELPKEYYRKGCAGGAIGGTGEFDSCALSGTSSGAVSRGNVSLGSMLLSGGR